MNHSLQPGDVILEIQGQRYPLRLTLGALAELSSRLDCQGPAALGQRMRALDRPALEIILSALGAQSIQLTPNDIAPATQAVCELFEQAFSDV